MVDQTLAWPVGVIVCAFQRIERPQCFAGSHIKSIDRAFGRICTQIIADRRSCDHDVTDMIAGADVI